MTDTMLPPATQATTIAVPIYWSEPPSVPEALAPARREAPWRWLGVVLIALAALLPAIPWLRDLPRFGELQYNDYYGNVAQVIDRDNFTLDPVRWLAIKSNEHTVTVPTLLYALNYSLTGGDNRGLSLMAILLAIGCATGIAAMARSIWGIGRPAAALVALAASALLFTPTSVHSYVMGFSGAIWITTNALAVLSMVLLTRANPGHRAVRMLAVVGIGALGAISYTTNLSSWPALLLGGWLLALRGRQLGVLAGGAAAVFFVQWLVRTRPNNHPSPQKELGAILEYLGVYLGWPFANGLGAATALGLFGATTAVVLLGWAARARRREVAQPAAAAAAMRIVYGFGNGLGTAIGRSGFGIDQATSSRYASLAVLFWLGVLILGVWAALRCTPRFARLPRSLACAVPVVGAVVLTICTWQRGADLRRQYYDQAAWSPVAAIALRHGILGDREVLGRVNNAPEQFAGVPWLELMQHVPFTTPRPVHHRIQVDAAHLRDRPDPRIAGAFDQLAPVTSGAARVQAWAFARGDARIVEALLLDEQGCVRGELALGSPRDDIMRKVDARQRYCGVRGYAFADPEISKLRIWVRLLGDDHYTPLPGRVAYPALAAR
jgi:hypothetical protein